MAPRKRGPRRLGWSLEVREKESAYFDKGFAYEIRMFSPRFGEKKRKPIRETLRETLAWGHRLVTSRVGRRVRSVIYVKSEGDLLILRMADIGDVFRVYKLRPKTS